MISTLYAFVESGVASATDAFADASVVAISSFVFSWMKTLDRGSLSELTETLLAIFFEGVKSSAA